MVIAGGSMLLTFARARYPSTEQSKYSSCTGNSLKYSKENQGIYTSIITIEFA